MNLYQYFKYMRGLMRSLNKFFFIILALILANLVSSFSVGFLTAVSSNIQVIGFNTLSFDPLITIAYMMLYYFVTLFFQPGTTTQFYMFLLALFLSFTTPFVQGAVMLVALFFLLRKFNQI